MIERLWVAWEKKLFPERYLRTKENKEIIRMDFSARRRSLSTDKVHALSEKIMSKQSIEIYFSSMPFSITDIPLFL